MPPKPNIIIHHGDAETQRKKMIKTFSPGLCASVVNVF
jgi:hypothetical protein